MAEILVVEDVLKRIKQLTGDLEKIRQGYSNRIGPLETSLSANNFFEAQSTQVIAELDAAVDDLQHVVWLYTETASSRGMRDAVSPSKLLSRATEILCALSARPPLPKPDADTSGSSFVERLIKLMEGPSD
ncbi:MAG TPA: hypothetical protein VI685_24200, partial [Candidatus Angelobacter sp.]